jgi:glyoxylase-like metal-dependent hydrolase (beta-lactamase superfamily II)
MYSVVGAAAAATTLICANALAQPNFQPQPLELTKVQDDLYVIHNSQSGNVTVLVSDEGVLIIDDKFEFDYDNIVAMIATITDQPVRYVINTHYHQDHSGGNAQMQAASAVVFASENARLKLIEDERGGLPNVTLQDRLRIHFGGEPVDLYYFGRSHTDGDIVIHLPERDLVVMGDMFASYEPFAQLIHYAAGGSAREWTRSLDKALGLDFATVIPGHSPPTDRAMLEAYRDVTARTAQTVLEMNRQDRSKDEIAAVLRNEFGWGDFFVNLGLDGIVAEMQ